MEVYEADIVAGGRRLSFAQSMALRVAVADRLYTFDRYSTRLGDGGRSRWDVLSTVQEAMRLAVERGLRAPVDPGRSPARLSGDAVSIGGVALSAAQRTALLDAARSFVKRVEVDEGLGPIGPLYCARLREVMSLASGG